MKSKFFRDTHGLDAAFEQSAPDKVSVCLRVNRQAYDFALSRSRELGVTSGELVEALLLRERERRAQRLM